MVKIFSFCAILCTGFISGSIFNKNVVVSQVILACEDDECEGGYICKDNESGNTGCSFDGEGCTTYACEKESTNN